MTTDKPPDPFSRGMQIVENLQQLNCQEDQVRHHRMFWLVFIEGFLFGAFGTSFDKSTVLSIAFCLIGISLSVSFLYVFSLGSKANKELAKHEQRLFTRYNLDTNDFPPTSGFQAPQDIRRKLLVPWRFLPFLFVVAWLFFLVLAAVDHEPSGQTQASPTSTAHPAAP